MVHKNGESRRTKDIRISTLKVGDLNFWGVFWREGWYLLHNVRKSMDHLESQGGQKKGKNFSL